jgi:hypothetical protein
MPPRKNAAPWHPSDAMRGATERLQLAEKDHLRASFPLGRRSNREETTERLSQKRHEDTVFETHLDEARCSRQFGWKGKSDLENRKRIQALGTSGHGAGSLYLPEFGIACARPQDVQGATAPLTDA